MIDICDAFTEFLCFRFNEKMCVDFIHKLSFCADHCHIMPNNFIVHVFVETSCILNINMLTIYFLNTVLLKYYSYKYLGIYNKNFVLLLFLAIYL